MFFCGSSWGIGVYTIDNDMTYGYPPRDMNPHDFSPDYECCTEKEIKAWETAKANWHIKNNKKGDKDEIK